MFDQLSYDVGGRPKEVNTPLRQAAIDQVVKATLHGPADVFEVLALLINAVDLERDPKANRKATEGVLEILEALEEKGADLEQLRPWAHDCLEVLGTRYAYMDPDDLTIRKLTTFAKNSLPQGSW
jgi:hypothetical protein